MRSSVMMGVFVAMVFGLAGCGGGGGGGDSGGGTSYKGITTQATVSTNNAKAVSVDVFQAVQNSAAINVLGKSVTDTPETSPQILAIANILEQSIKRNLHKSAVAKTVALTEQGTEYGYSGSFSYSGNFNDTTGAGSGTLTFSQYQSNSGAPTLSGNITLSGVMNTTTGNFVSLNITVSNLNVVLGSESRTLSGSITINGSDTSQTLKISLVNTDNVSKKTYWLKDFIFVVAGTSMTVSGTYYDHDLGYVVVTTITPLTVSSYAGTPTSGQLLFTGANGTKARLTFTNQGHTLEVDSSGNNTYVEVTTPTPTPTPTPTNINYNNTLLLRGTWTFAYTIISTFTNTYVLNTINPTPNSNGNYFISGTSTYGDLVVGSYYSASGDWSILDQGTIIDRFFMFKTNGINVLSGGCYYQISHPSETMSSCFPLSGIKTNLTTKLVSKALDTSASEKAEAEKDNQSVYSQPDDAAKAMYLKLRSAAGK